jgi:hypothetical protein
MKYYHYSRPYGMDKAMIIMEDFPVDKVAFPIVNTGEFGGWLVQGPSWMR